MKYTVIWVESWQSGSHWHSITRMTRFINTPIETIMNSEYGGKAQFILEGHPLCVGTAELESKPICLTN